MVINSVAALFALLPIAGAVSKEPPREPGNARVGDCGSRISPDARRRRDFLAQLESTLDDLRRRYVEEHPRIRVVKARIAEVTLLLNALECSPFRPLGVEA